MRAYPVNKDGDKTGKVKNFTPEQWDALKRTFGTKLRWRKYERTRRGTPGSAVK